MNLDNFIKKYLGKKVEVAGSANAKFQCVDLVNLYIRDILKLPIIEWTNAKDFPKKAGNKYDYIKNTPLGIPKNGDLVVWGSGAGGGYGHIAIFINGDANKFTSFDQNWSVKQKCKIENHYYTNVIGWLHPKEVTMSDDSDIQKKLNSCKKDREKFWKERDELKKEYDLYVGEAENKIEDMEGEIRSLRTRNVEQQKQIEAVASRLGCGKELGKILAAIEQGSNAMDAVDGARKETEKIKRNFDDLQNEVNKELAFIQDYIDVPVKSIADLRQALMAQRERLVASVEVELCDLSIRDLIKELVRRILHDKKTMS